MTAPLNDRLVAATADARAALLDAITASMPDLDRLRDETQQAYRNARAATAAAQECMTIIRRRIPFGRKADLPTTSRVVSERQWEHQQTLDASRGALTREDAVVAFDTATAALAANDDAHAAYVETTARWNDAVEQLTAACMACGAPWTPDPPATGLAVLVLDLGGRRYGCSVDGRTFTAASELHAPEPATDHRVIRDHAAFFEWTWTEPPPPPEPPPPREPTPWDALPSSTATVDPAEAWARAMGASHV